MGGRVVGERERERERRVEKARKKRAGARAYSEEVVELLEKRGEEKPRDAKGGQRESVLGDEGRNITKVHAAKRINELIIPRGGVRFPPPPSDTTQCVALRYVASRSIASAATAEGEV